QSRPSHPRPSPAQARSEQAQSAQAQPAQSNQRSQWGAIAEASTWRLTPDNQIQLIASQPQQRPWGARGQVSCDRQG
ncbi:MAG: hypothetical protein HC824_18590, partial [Synechococcales cyanobacterium RM1_1_8]|nr:hypothetical protein [Synechococcales cyanobacterium RM1_1_8]